MGFRGPLISFFLAVVATPLCVAENGIDEPFTSSFTRLSHAPCLSLFHRNGRVGCGTEDQSLQVGQLKYFDGSLPDTAKPYVAVMEEDLLTATSLDTLLAARGGLLQGVLVLNSTSEEDGGKNSNFYSPDSQTPRGYGTPSANINSYGSSSWNPKGQDLFAYDMHGIPMAYVIDSDVSASLRQEAQSVSDAANDAIVAEFNYYMGPENMDSSECLAWKDKATDEWNPKCLPLAGTSVWASAGSPPNPSSNSNKNSNSKRPVVILAAGMDSTSMFHDLTPGANTAASNILTLLMAARLIGKSVSDQTLDALPNRIVVALFEGETYGFVGSRSFLRDVAYPGFSCDGDLVYSVSRLGDKSDLACLNPLRPSLQFDSLGQINGMLSVDQVAQVVGDGILYVHADKNNDKTGAFMANVLKYSGTSYFSVAAATSSNNNDNAYSYPPTPLTSLLQLSGGAVGGAVLTGYDYAFLSSVPYHSHRDSASMSKVNLKSIAAAATIVARGILAAAYDDGSYDYATAATYAKSTIEELADDDEVLVELADCLLYNGECDMLKKYSSVEVQNDRIRTGVNVGSPNPLGTPPNYYVGVYNRLYGQPFVQVGDQYYGAYNGEDYGNKNSDVIHMLPELLETAIHGLLNDFLGKGSSDANGVFDECKTVSNCANVDYCSAYGDRATCTGGGVCVCARAQYHVALDEAILPAENKPAGYFVVDEDDAGVSAMYTEPFWSNSVGVRVYRDAGWLPGFLTLAAGIGVGSLSLFAAFVLKVGLKKEKLY
jgi:nicastrin